MSGEVQNTNVVKKGDTLWAVATKNLKAQQKSVTNADIIREMNRIANVNGYDDYQSFNKDTFSRVGKEYKLNSDSSPRSGSPYAPSVRSDISVADNTRMVYPTRLNPPVIPDDKPAPQTPKTKKTKPSKSTGAEQTPATRTAKTSRSRGVAQTTIPRFEIDTKSKVSPQQQYVNYINGLQSDKDRIIAYNRDNYSEQYYGIVNKKTCQLEIYDRDGNCVEKFTIGVGKKRGDDLGHHYYSKTERDADKTGQKARLAETGRYTPAGEFTLDELSEDAKGQSGYRGADGKLRLMHLKGDNRGEDSGQMAIHQLPNYCAGQRGRAIRSKGLDDNRMSYGCVNLLAEDYDKMHKYLGEGCKLYVLPEEEDNKLVLERQSDGSYKFEQLNHRADKRAKTKEEASKVYYDIRPERKKKPTKQLRANGQVLSRRPANQPERYFWGLTR